MADGDSTKNKPNENSEQYKRVENTVDKIVEKAAAGVGEPSVDGGGDGVVEQFKSLPLGMLICEPILQAARGQAALCDVYLDNVNRLAFENPDEKDITKRVTKTIQFPYEKPVLDKTTGQVSMKKYNITAPVISLVPLPAFLMDEMTVNFSMEVHNTDTNTNSSHSEASASSSFSFWGCSADISGSVSSDSSHTRVTDNSAKYEVYVRASQQPAAEGMAKLTSLLAQTMEPIEMKK